MFQAILKHQTLDIIKKYCKKESQKILEKKLGEYIFVKEKDENSFSGYFSDGLFVKNIDGEEFKNKYGFKCPVGVRGRNSDNKLYKEKMGWEVSTPLINGMTKTFEWINQQVNK
jgi:hypothetical protein